MSEFNKGDMVRVIDGSYSLGIENGDFKHVWGMNLIGRDFKVLHTDLKLPSTDDDQFNTIILRAMDDDQIVYTQERFVKSHIEIVKPIIINLTISSSESFNVEQFAKTIKDSLKNIGCS
ncbi:MAG TPA: hypothetical protein VIM70_06120 [Clostridium sp.]|uniref:hypothetical protein n=1 Tax=Clostridium sp. TaxID=1506 RepID=UPI002F92A10F